MKWKPRIEQVKQNYLRWWNREGFVLVMRAPRDEPLADLAQPTKPEDLTVRWTDPTYRVRSAEYGMSRSFYGADAIPACHSQIGPGSLATFLGSTPHFAESTVWYEPIIDEPDEFGELHFDPKNNPWWDVHVALIDEAVRSSDGRYMIALPDMIENLDVLASLRDSQKLLFDLIERPDWVQTKLAEINQAFFDSYDLLYERTKEINQGSCFIFEMWSPGKVAKVQCDISCMVSPGMFNEFVVPHLAAQCEWLDHSLYHLDGEDAMQHLDALLSIDALDAIEWTPRGVSGNDPSSPPGGSPQWYDLYKRIKDAGKCVQAIRVFHDEVIPLLDAVGPEGLFMCADAPDQATAEKIIEQAETYR